MPAVNISPRVRRAKRSGLRRKSHMGTEVMCSAIMTFDAILLCQVHMAVIVIPIKFTGSNFDITPEKPMAEDIHAFAGSLRGIPFPIRFRWIGFAEIDSAVRELRYLFAYLWHFSFLVPRCVNSMFIMLRHRITSR